MASWVFTLDGTALGAGTPFIIGEAGIGGLGVPQPKTTDVELGHAGGVHFGVDYPSTRVITIPFVLVADTTDEVLADFAALCDLWAVSSVDADLVIFGTTYTGRTRGLTEDLSKLRAGVIEALGTFYANPPSA